jgi:NADPH:quinone reductase-like Zn-dependent oxidoreductase
MNTSHRTNPAAAAQQDARAVVIDSFGGAESLRTTVVPLPGPSASEVQLQVAAVAVNQVDLQTRSGRAIPV